MIVNYRCPKCGSMAMEIEDLSDYPHSKCGCGTMRRAITRAEMRELNKA